MATFTVPSSKSAKPVPLDPASHATIHALVLELEALALRLDKGAAILRELKATEDARYEATLAKWEEVDQEYRNTFDQFDLVLGNSRAFCPCCSLDRGEKVDLMNPPIPSRLCPDHGKDLIAWRGRLRNGLVGKR